MNDVAIVGAIVVLGHRPVLRCVSRRISARHALCLPASSNGGPRLRGDPPPLSPVVARARDVVR